MLINLNVSSFFQGPPGPSGPKGERVMCPLGSVFVTCLIHRLLLCYPLQWNDLKFLDIILFSDLLLYFKYWYFDCHIFYLGWYRTEGRIWTSGKITVLLYFKHFTYKRYYFYHFWKFCHWTLGTHWAGWTSRSIPSLPRWHFLLCVRAKSRRPKKACDQPSQSKFPGVWPQPNCSGNGKQELRTPRWRHSPCWKIIWTDRKTRWRDSDDQIPDRERGQPC